MPDLNVVLQGTGTPEGVVEALPGQRYFDYIGNDLYLKEQGDGKVGWVKAGGSGGGGGGAVGVGDSIVVRGYTDSVEDYDILDAIQAGNDSLHIEAVGTSLIYDPALIIPAISSSPRPTIQAKAAGLYSTTIRIMYRFGPTFTGDYLEDYFDEAWKDAVSGDVLPLDESTDNGVEAQPYFHVVHPASMADQDWSISVTIPPMNLPVDAACRPYMSSGSGPFYLWAVKVVKIG